MDGDGYVFTMDDGRPLHPQSVSRAFDRAIAAAKLPSHLVAQHEILEVNLLGGALLVREHAE